MNDFEQRVRKQIEALGSASPAMLTAIDAQLRLTPTADLWILRGDAIQLSDGEEYSLEDAEKSYRQAIKLDPTSAAAYEELAYFTFAVKADARGSLALFKRAIELGNSASAREGLRVAIEDLAEDDEF